VKIGGQLGNMGTIMLQFGYDFLGVVTLMRFGYAYIEKVSGASDMGRGLLGGCRIGGTVVDIYIAMVRVSMSDVLQHDSISFTGFW